MCCINNNNNNGSHSGNDSKPSILVSSITISANKKELVKGKSVYFHATVCPDNADNKGVAWSSSNTKIATVNPQSGLVLAQNPGTVSIQATALDGSGATGTYQLTVTEPVLVKK